VARSSRAIDLATDLKPLEKAGIRAGLFVFDAQNRKAGIGFAGHRAAFRSHCPQIAVFFGWRHADCAAKPIAAICGD
jgi:hypothetical protein